MKDHITEVRPRTLPKPKGFSYAMEVKHGRVVFVAGQVAVNAAGAIVGRGDLVAQFRQTCANLHAVITAAGGEMTDFVKLTIYVLDVADYKKHLHAIGDVYRESFAAASSRWPAPSTTTVWWSGWPGWTWPWCRRCGGTVRR